MSLTEHLLRGPLSTSAARPLITHYDDAVGSRVELSTATLANWAAKTANWLVEEFDVEPGDEVVVDLPAHWQTAGVLLGSWWCGAHVVGRAHPAESAPEAAVAFVGPEADAEPARATAARATAVVALDPLGRGLGSAVPEGALDYLSEARVCGDEFSPLLPVDRSTPALAGASVDDVLTRARERATALGIGAGDRVLCTREWTLPDGVIDALVAPVAAGAHLVQVTHADGDALARHRDTERTTVELT